MTNGLPTWYIKWITRVSELVSFAFPFAWTEEEKRYKEWLVSKGINEVDYHKEACDVWTFVHLQMEKSVLGKELDKNDVLYKLHSAEIEGWLTFIKESAFTNIQTEVYCRDKHNRYQGSIDLLATNKEGKRILIDWKTFWIAKKKWLLNNNSAKPYSKLKKVALQLSLYAKALWNIDEIYMVWLHEKWTFVFKLDITPDKELEALLTRYTTIHRPLIFNCSDMIIEIRKPTEQYGYVNIIQDLSKIDNGRTPKETIDDMIKTSEYLVSKLSK